MLPQRLPMDITTLLQVLRQELDRTTTSGLPYVAGPFRSHWSQ